MASSYLVFTLVFVFFRNKSVCFGCFETDPKQTETKQKNNFLVSRNKPKMNRNRLCFGLFRFEPKKKFDCFEDTLVMGVNTSLITTMKSNNMILEKSMTKTPKFYKLLFFLVHMFDQNFFRAFCH
jgi:hypothetical protein